MNELIITWQGLLFEVAAFLIFTYLLNLFLFRPIRTLLKKRGEIVSASNESQKYFEGLIEKLNEETELKKNNLKIEINTIKENHRKEGLAEAAGIIFSAKKNASIKFDDIIKDFSGEKNSIINYYKSKSEELANLIYKKILE
ncbi:MAG: ATP synthase subunit B family protein [bacterium]